MRDSHVVLFDCDGTLYDDRAAFAQFLVVFQRVVSARSGLAPDAILALRAQLRAEHNGENSTSLIASYFHWDAIELAASVYGTIDLDQAGVRDDPKLRTVLDRISGLRAVWSNNPRVHVERVLHALGVRDRFSIVIAAEDVAPVEKPNPIAYQIVAGLFPTATRICFVENDARNLLPAIAIGWDAVLLIRDAVPEQLDSRIRVIRSLLEL